MIQLLSFKPFCLCDPPVRVYNAEELLTKLRLFHCGVINIITVILAKSTCYLTTACCFQPRGGVKQTCSTPVVPTRLWWCQVKCPLLQVFFPAKYNNNQECVFKKLLLSECY